VYAFGKWLKGSDHWNWRLLGQAGCGMATRDAAAIVDNLPFLLPTMRIQGEPDAT
jgi:hypothetical protein